MNYWICKCGKIIPYTQKEDCTCGMDVVSLSVGSGIGLIQVVSFSTEKKLVAWIKLMNATIGPKIRRWGGDG